MGNAYSYRRLIHCMDIYRLLEWIKFSLRHLLFLSLFTGFRLFAPQTWLVVFGLGNLAVNNGD